MQFNLRGDRGHPFCSTLQLSRSFKMLHWFLRAAFGNSFRKGKMIASIAQGKPCAQSAKAALLSHLVLWITFLLRGTTSILVIFIRRSQLKKLLLQFFLNAVHCVPTTPPSAHPCAPGGWKSAGLLILAATTRRPDDFQNSEGERVRRSKTLLKNLIWWQ